MALIMNVSDYEELAKQKLSKMFYDFYASGAEDQRTLKENREAFSRILFRPRVLIDVSRIDMSLSVLGYNISMPIMLAPTALHKLAHPEGEVASARAAAAAGTIMVWKIAPLYWLNDDSHVNFFTGYIFRLCLHGHLVVLKKLARVDQDSVSFNFQYSRTGTLCNSLSEGLKTLAIRQLQSLLMPHGLVTGKLMSGTDSPCLKMWD